MPELKVPSQPGRTLINIGPSHPAMHGTIKMVMELEGEVIKDVDVEPGYLHRGFEKSCEDKNYIACVPYTDRLNYLTPLINNFGYVEAVEKLLKIDVTPRCNWLRTLLSEFSRIGDHLTCVGASAMEIGALTAFLYMVRMRDVIWEHIAAITGARLTVNYARIGGMRLLKNGKDMPDGWLERTAEILNEVEEVVAQAYGLLDHNRIFHDRMKGIGIISREDALSYGFTGPCLRSTGVALDCRKYAPYEAYAEVEFEVPVGKYGDNYDRYWCRMREIEESIRIIRQCIDRMPKGPINVKDYGAVMPSKDEVYNTMEGLIAHFELVMKGPVMPVGDIYHGVEGGNGEVGFYLVSDGSGKPYKLRCRPPSFILMGGVHKMLIGGQIADIIPTFGQINMIGGECDR